MNETNNKNKILEALITVAEVYGVDANPKSLGVLASDLSVFDENVVYEALNRYRRTFSGRFDAKAIYEQIDAVLGRLDANEAWAVALKSTDENATLVWNNEIAQAFGECRPILDGGDKIGARMAFISAYNRICLDARLAGAVPIRSISLGHDKIQREEFVKTLEVENKYPALVNEEIKYLGLPVDDKNKDSVAMLSYNKDTTEEVKDGKQSQAYKDFTEFVANFGQRIKKEKAGKEREQIINQFKENIKKFSAQVEPILRMEETGNKQQLLNTALDKLIEFDEKFFNNLNTSVKTNEYGEVISHNILSKTQLLKKKMQYYDALDADFVRDTLIYRAKEKIKTTSEKEN